MKEKGCGTFFKCCLSGEQIRLVGYAFVDDTDLIQTGKDIKTPLPQVMIEMQKSLDLWEGLIRATGGALRVDKCRYWAIDFHWEENGQWRFKTSNEIPGELKVRHFDDTIQTLQRLDHDAAYETLGVDLTPDDNIYPEFKKRLKKAKIWADKLRTSHLREQETAAALKATILKSLEYPLPAIFFSEEQHKKLMSIILRAALPKSRFNRNKCRRTVYGPGSHGGLEIHNLATTQIIEHMDMFLRHGPSDDICGQQLRASIQLAKAELGLPGNLFQHEFKQLGHLITNCWVKKAWEEFQNNGLQVKEATKSLTISRTGDIYIMEEFIKQGFKLTKLKCLNEVRIRLR